MSRVSLLIALLALLALLMVSFFIYGYEYGIRFQCEYTPTWKELK